MEEDRQAKDNLEKAFEEALECGEMDEENPEKAARERLAPRYEIRVEAKIDPIVEETLKYREIAEEVDRRYEKYLQRMTGQKRSKE